MAQRVEEIMNREIFSFRPSDPVDEALEWIVALGITGAPVTDPYGRPVGMASFRDLLRNRRGPTVGECMNSPVVAVKGGLSIVEAAQILAEHSFHRLVVVDEEGHAVGVVSASDLVRAMLGLPASHPASFSHVNTATGLSWTDDDIFDFDHVDRAPSAPGIFVLRVGGAGEEERDAWIEGTKNVRKRLRTIASKRPRDRRLELLLERFGSRLRYRTTVIEDAPQRRAVLDSLRGESGNRKLHAAR